MTIRSITDGAKRPGVVTTPKALTRKEYDALPPKLQGYATYMQGAWNDEVPNYCNYRKGSPQRKAFEQGEFEAMLEAQEGDD